MHRHDRARRDQDLHGHQRRPAREADRQEDRRSTTTAAPRRQPTSRSRSTTAARTTFEADGQNDLTVNAGNYSVTEPAAAGYTTTYDNCDNLAIANGETKTCTITNNDAAAKLIVKKIVINDNGGTKTAADFSFKVNGGNATPFEADGQNDLTVNAGNYSVTEPAAAGYTTTYDNCNNVAIANGATATCTITNNDQPAKLIVKKIVINDNGGTAIASDFSFKVNGGNAVSFEADGQNDLTVDAGNYSVTEPAADGYTTTYDNCDNVALANGETKTCTITNNDQPAKLIVIKQVVNDNGGKAVSSDFTLAVDATNPTPASFKGADSPGVEVSLTPGAYSVSETGGPAGYTGSFSADVHRHDRARRDQDLHGHQRRPAGEADRQEGRDQRQRRHQDAQPTSRSRSTAATPTPFEADGQNDLTVDAGNYSVTEPAAAGYTTTYDNCDDLTVANGETKTCTITNNDQPAKLIVKKIVINDNGGTKTAADFSFKVNGGNAHPVRGRRPERPHGQRRQLLGHRARSRRLHHHLRQLQRAGARQRRHGNLHRSRTTTSPRS